MKENMMGKKRSHYRSDTKRGFEAGELAGLLARHSPDADYRVVINFRGKVRELIVDEDEQTCATPADTETVQGRSRYFPRDFEDDQRHGGKLKAALHDPRAQWPETEDVGPLTAQELFRTEDD